MKEAYAGEACIKQGTGGGREASESVSADAGELVEVGGQAARHCAEMWGEKTIAADLRKVSNVVKRTPRQVSMPPSVQV